MVAMAAGGAGEVRKEMKMVDFLEGKEGYIPGERDHGDGVTLPKSSASKGWTMLLQIMRTHVVL